MTMRTQRAVAWFVVTAALIASLAPLFAQPAQVVVQTPPATPIVQVTPFSPALSKACWPTAMLTGADTAWWYVPCRSLEVLAPGFRAKLECTLEGTRKAGGDPLVQETMRSMQLQRIYWDRGRTTPGPRVTRVKDVRAGFHGYGLGADVISKKHGWTNGLFFNKLGHAAEACGLVAGVFWGKFPDGPHVQYAGWPGAPPLWARAMWSDSLHAVWRIAGVAM